MDATIVNAPDVQYTRDNFDTLLSQFCVQRATPLWLYYQRQNLLSSECFILRLATVSRRPFMIVYQPRTGT
jgi:hypothetical protein